MPSPHKSPPVAPREWAVLAAAGATLVFSAWSFGGVLAWSLQLLLLGGTLCFLFAVCPLPSRLNGTDGEHGNLLNLKRLLASPVFWCFFAFIIYLLLQAANPAITVVREGSRWWVEAIVPPLGVNWPSSVRSEYEPMNVWRVLQAFLAAFGLALGIHVGLRRRRSALLLLWVFVVSGTAMAAVAIAQRFTEAEAVLWSIPSSNRNPWGSFFYRNQAVAYLNLVLTATTFLYFHHAHRTRELARSGGPHFLLFFFCAVLAASIGLALSRGGILFAAVILACFLVLAVLQHLLSFSGLGRSLAISLILAALVGGGAYLAYSAVDWEAVDERFGDVGATIQQADRDGRVLATRATWDMAQDRLWLGWGAGSFRYVFPLYLQNYPDIFYRRNHPHRGYEGRRIWQYAHNDIVQFVAEYGLIGTTLVFGGILCLLAATVWFASGATVFGTLILLVGTGTLFSHAFLDFIFNSPAFWTAFLGVLALAATHVRHQSRRDSPSLIRHPPSASKRRLCTTSS